LGVNFLAVTGKQAFPILASLQAEGVRVDAYWADDARIDERVEVQTEAADIAALRGAACEGKWDGMYFGGTAFKKQRVVDPEKYEDSARIAARYMDVVTTSGVATGQAADGKKISTFRTAIGKTPLAIASGINPENVHEYMDQADAFLVATGINHPGDFYNINPRRLALLLQRTRSFGASNVSEVNEVDDKWYLKNMAPNVKDPKMAWLDPSAAYVNAKSFHAMLDKLCEPFYSVKVDVVAGLDAAGYVLGAAMADRLGVGFLTVRKAGKLPVPADEVSYVNYTQRTQHMELRKPAFHQGTQVLLVDQWIETGGTMSAGIELVEKQGGNIAGIATICIEDSSAGDDLRKKYLCATCVEQGSVMQQQCNAKSMDHFTDFDWETIMP
jgi:adenine phosphoribosyltransferase